MQSCLEACQARGLSFEAILSEKFIEGHSPVYWVIVKRQPTSADAVDDQVSLLDIILSVPLNPTTRSEAYLACLMSSDQELFQRLRRTPGVQTPSVSAADELLLGEAPGDQLSVENQEGDNGEFRVYWKIAEFQKRVRALGGIGTEVVARSSYHLCSVRHCRPLIRRSKVGYGPSHFQSFRVILICAMAQT